MFSSEHAGEHSNQLRTTGSRNWLPLFNQFLIERVREYWDSRPCNIRHSPKPVGTREYFDEGETRKYFVGPHILRFAEFERWRGKRVLEFGGIGTDLIYVARNCISGTALDFPEKSLEMARYSEAETCCPVTYSYSWCELRDEKCDFHVK